MNEFINRKYKRLKLDNSTLASSSLWWALIRNALIWIKISWCGKSNSQWMSSFDGHMIQIVRMYFWILSFKCVCLTRHNCDCNILFEYQTLNVRMCICCNPANKSHVKHTLFSRKQGVKSSNLHHVIALYKVRYSFVNTRSAAVYVFTKYYGFRLESYIKMVIEGEREWANFGMINVRKYAHAHTHITILQMHEYWNCIENVCFN